MTTVRREAYGRPADADAPNRPDFPTTRLRPGESFITETEWRFGVAAEEAS